MVERQVRERRRPPQTTGAAQGEPAPEPSPQEENASDGSAAAEAGESSAEGATSQQADSGWTWTEPAFSTPTRAEVYQAVLAEFMPMGIVEESWCRDIARNVVHAHRLRQVRDGYLRAAATKVLHEAVRNSFTYVDFVASGTEINQRIANNVALLRLGRAKAIEAGYQQDYEDALRKVKNIGFDLNEVNSLAYVENMSKVEALEKLIVVTDSRRDILVREFERRRSTDAARLMPGAFRHVRRGYP